MSLFRPEARESLKVRLEGEVVALTPPSTKVLTVILLAALASAITFSSIATYTKYVPAVGTLAPKEGLVNVIAPLQAELVELRVQQGQKVKAGEALGVLKSTQQQAEGVQSYQKEQSLIEARKDIGGKLAEARLAEQLGSLELARAKARDAAPLTASAEELVRTAESRVQTAQRELDRQKSLLAQGFVSPSSLLTLEQYRLDALQTLQQAKSALMARRQDELQAKQQVLQQEKQIEVTRATSKEAEISLEVEAQRLEASSQAVVASTVDGTVLAVPAKKGMVAQNSVLFVVAPEGDTYAHLLLTESSAQKAKTGQEVTLRVVSKSFKDSVPLKGTLESISQAPLALNGVPDQSGYLALVHLDNQQDPSLLLGSRVEARLSVTTKSLLGWLFEGVTQGLWQTKAKL